MKKERLLTSEEILLILEKAKNEVYKIPGAIFMFSVNSITSILTVTEKGLIFIKGNSDTGFTHIKERHNYYTERVDWYQNQEKPIKILDNPSKFSPRSIPILDYTKIVDDIFCENNKQISKNPDLFDKYTGTSDVFENRELKFHLLLYNDTKIVHTLFPDKKTYNKNKVINLVKESCRAELSFDDNFLMIEIPYKNSELIVRYLIIFRVNYDNRLGNVYIQVNLHDGKPLFTTLISDSHSIPEGQLEPYLMRLNAADLSPIEKIIKQIELDVFNAEL